MIELVIVIIIIGIIGAIAMARYGDFACRAKAKAELANVRLIFDAASQYEAVNCSLPRDGFTNQYPPDFQGYLDEGVFKRKTPGGGRYDWNGPAAWAHKPSVSIKFPSGTSAATLDVYQQLEAIADDGVANKGWIRVSGRAITFLY
jgi:type II secretory pathway pseudopilin PulG